MCIGVLKKRGKISASLDKFQEIYFLSTPGLFSESLFARQSYVPLGLLCCQTAATSSSWCIFSERKPIKLCGVFKNKKTL